MSGWAVPGYIEERELGQGASGRVVAAVDQRQRPAGGDQVPSAEAGRATRRSWRASARRRRCCGRSTFRTSSGCIDYVEEPGAGRRDRDGAGRRGLAARDDLPPGRDRPRGRARGTEGVAARAGRRARGSASCTATTSRRTCWSTPRATASWRTSASRSRPGKRLPSAGTPLYMAPEQWNGAPSSPATDIYAAAAVFFECLTGKTPVLRATRRSCASSTRPWRCPLDQVSEPRAAEPHRPGHGQGPGGPAGRTRSRSWPSWRRWPTAALRRRLGGTGLRSPGRTGRGPAAAAVPGRRHGRVVRHLDRD